MILVKEQYSKKSNSLKLTISITIQIQTITPKKPNRNSFPPIILTNPNPTPIPSLTPNRQTHYQPIFPHQTHQMYSQTLQSLSAKLQTSNNLSLQQRRRLQEESQLKLLAIQSILKQKKIHEAQDIGMMKEKLGCVSRLCEETVRNFGIKSQKQQQLVSVLREQLQNEIDQQQKQHQDKVQNIVQASQVKLQRLINQNQKKIKSQKDKTQLLLNNLSKTLSTLQTNLTQQKQTRQQNCLKITSQIQQQITHFHQVIEKQKQKRMSSQRKLNAMMEEIEKKVRGEMELQVQKRKKNNEALLRLIEVACNRLQEATNG